MPFGRWRVGYTTARRSPFGTMMYFVGPRLAANINAVTGEQREITEYSRRASIGGPMPTSCFTWVTMIAARSHAERSMWPLVRTIWWRAKAHESEQGHSWYAVLRAYRNV